MQEKNNLTLKKTENGRQILKAQYSLGLQFLFVTAVFLSSSFAAAIIDLGETIIDSLGGSLGGVADIIKGGLILVPAIATTLILIPKYGGSDSNCPHSFKELQSPNTILG